MKRYTGQKALYEAISRSRAKAKRGSILERLRPEAPGQEQPAAPEEQTPTEPMKAPAEASQPVAKEPSRPLLEKLKEAVIVKESAKLRRLATMVNEDAPAEKPVSSAVRARPVEKTDRPAPRPGAVPRWWRLKPVQLNAGRVEVSVPYHIGIVAALVVILVVLAAFRMGQKFSGVKTPAPAAAKTPAKAASPNAAEVASAKPTQGSAPATSSSAGEPARKEPDHWIVLAQHKNAADLEEVAKYFDQHDVKLSVSELGYIRKLFKDNGYNAANLPAGDGYLLTTKYLYSNPDKPGTDGYDIKQKIIELGKSYKAPKGSDTFAATRFRDAYGMKISKLAQ